ncbi:hypothetical protein BGZ76_004595 [Entomortierella beljakovae]|nr:hypothetical protein BGZ76_004595 [Entomortierella beljakovae]
MTPQPVRPKLSYKSSDSSFTSYEATRLLEETENKDLKFDFSYWKIATVGSTAREILVMNNTNHELHSPTKEEWTENKVPTTFSYLPMLKVTAPNGKELTVSESMVIDVFLAERFGLLGENKFESITIQSFYSNINYLRERTFSEVADVPKEYKFTARDFFMTHTFKKFLEDHEYHLKENGNNGHYVGDKLSLADLHLSNIIHYYGTLPWAKMALDAFKSYEAIWKVKETVDKIPEIAAWRATKLFKEYEDGSIDFYKRCIVPEDESREE